jgi:dTMP kinase
MASLFYALDRFDASEEVKQYIEQYDYVISNRYVSASMIHQTGKIQDTKEGDAFLDWLSEMEYGICGIPKPDMTIFLDVPPRKEQRAYITGSSNKDIHEADEHHLNNAYAKAIYAADKFGWKRVACTQADEILPLETITSMILETIL